ncbi:DUF1800 domain-containing protein [Amphritea japonica]|uniref:DUF1800 domain-containing protein n=1 Tax=Amphritea japonica ATCC BAA-1530 TaxID=1278309 RepID=A0A7R6PEE2_9GAMM|nr:DUF1800 domain-containing protein [Amphritea japonica]BBB27938.1 conserved hypothetical protein [Amphritea japonica ATCC BAA-1530]
MISFSQNRALNRFGLGLSPSDVKASSADPKGWLLQQLQVQQDPGPKVADAASSLVAFHEWKSTRKLLSGSEDSDKKNGELKALQKSFADRELSNFNKRFEYAAQSRTPFRERLVQFYSNHFSVSRKGKRIISLACVAYENEAIRSNLNNSFSDMLLAAVSHPVMLIYLDNDRSIGPDSVAGRKSKRGLNENLAREILELHTLGVSGGYKQKDVLALANMITGWGGGGFKSKNPRVKPGEFYFSKHRHQPGTQVLLGKQYNFEGLEQGRRALTDLALDFSTARFIATKLAKHFIADNPPAEVISILERSFLISKGHLPTLHRTLVNLEAAWDPALKKFRTPYDYVLSAVRTIDLSMGGRIKKFVRTGLVTMNQPPFLANSPAGWSDEARYWSSSSALKKRVEWGLAAGSAIGASPRMIEWLITVLPAEADNLKLAMSRAASPAQAASLMLASPYFQWR